MGDTAQPNHSGKVLEGRYSVGKPLGQGGMASVYKAQDEHRKIPVAVKFLLADGVQTDADLERLKQEALVLNELDHPNLVHVFAFGIHPEGGPYLILEYFYGDTVEELIERRGAFNWVECVAFLSQLCEGLEHAHGLNILHRDLKPSNIMIVDEDGKRVLKLLDFGIAKNLTLDKAMSLTRKGEVFGSPLYMSPEQCQALPIDPRADIYSIGCVAYEMLTGQPPLVAETWLATVVKHVTEMPVAPRALVPETPEALESVVMRCLQKQKEARYQSVSELLTDLKQLS